MRISHCIIPITSIFIMLCSACSDVEAPDHHENRSLYYGIGGNNSANDAGFYRFDLKSLTSQKLGTNHVEHVSQVAENGIVLYSEKAGSSTALFGRCEDGSIIPVPFPVSESATFTYRYNFPPQVTLSSQGHHAVYPVMWVSRNAQDPASYAPFIVRFNCAKWEMNLIPADSIITSIMSTQGATQGRICGDELLISGDGSTVWFSAAGLTSGTQPDTVGYALLEWKNEIVTVIRGVGSVPIDLEGYNKKTRTLIFREGMQRLVVNTKTHVTNTFPVPTEITVQPRQICVEYDAVALWENEVLAVRRCSDGSSIYPLISNVEIKNRFEIEYTFDAHNTISMAPDGIWIAFTLTRANEPLVSDLFVIRGNGSELLRVAGKLPHGIASISAEIHN